MNNLLEFYERFWNRQHDALFAMERNGIGINLEALADSEQRALAYVSDATQKLNDWAGCELNWNSSQQLIKFLYGWKDFPVAPYMGTAKAVKLNRDRKPSTTEVAIEHIRSLATTSPSDREHLELFLRMRKATKSGQFLAGLPRNVINGRLHTQLAPETETGRLSSRNPNLQNIPRSNDEYKIRRAFVAKPGHVLVVCDYSQLELYVLAHFLVVLLNDHALAHDLAAGDVHVETAKRCWGDPRRRDDAKVINYSVNYGKTAAGLGAQILDDDGVRIGTHKAQELLDAYFTAYPAIPAFQQLCINQAKETGKITTLLGRHRHIDFGSAEWQFRAAARKCPNTRIQGSAADIVTAAMLRCHSDASLRGTGANILLQVHDELIFEVPEISGPAALERVQYLMANPFQRKKLAVTLKVSGALADTWGEAK